MRRNKKGDPKGRRVGEVREKKGDGTGQSVRKKK
jgi:hypothetical protein